MNNVTTKILIGVIVLLTLSNIYFYKKTKAPDTLGANAYDQEQKCLSWTTYSPTFDAWMWRAETFNQYFPTREEAVSNCIVTLNVIPD